jgi:hypothetical protein
MASGNTLAVFTAQHAQPPTSAFATPDVRNGLLVVDFDPTTDESTVFIGILPRHYSGAGITLYLHWMASTATSGSCRWQAAFERHLAGTDDSDADSFASPQSAGSAAVSPSGTEIVTTIAYTNGAQIDGLVVGERFRLKITRDADGTSGTDDMAGDAELVAVELRET